MAKIIVNDSIKVNGNLTVSRKKVVDEKGVEHLINEGQFRTHLYFESIESLKTIRVDIDGIDVFEEIIGSDDYMMTYNFTFKDLDFGGAFLKDIEAYSFLSPEEMGIIEDEMFKDDHSILGGIGNDYKDLVFDEKEDLEDMEEGE